MLHNIGSPYRAPAVRFFQRKNVRKKKREKERKGVPERKRERERDTSSGRRRRLKYFRGSRGRAIIEKGFHLAPILAGKKCLSRANEVSSFHRELICLHRSFVWISPAAIHGECDTSPREKEDYPAEKLRVYASFASTFTANEIMHERAQDGLAERQRARPRVRIYGTKIATAARKLSF